MIPMTTAQVAQAIGAEVAEAAGAVTVRRVTTDSRDVRPGDLFFAIEGARFDGHAFVTDAVSRGAVACVCARDSSVLVADAAEVASMLYVDDTTAALGALACHYRRRIMSPDTSVIAVTGSNGKTTAKFMIDHVLSAAFLGRAAPRSYNNEIGVPLTLLSAEPDDRYVVVEIGSNAPGEVSALAKLARPDVAVVTSIGEAHLAGFGDLAGVVAEKMSLLDAVVDDGLAVVCCDVPLVMDMQEQWPGVRVVRFGESDDADWQVRPGEARLDVVSFELVDNGSAGAPSAVLSVPLPGMHHAGNAATAFVVGRHFGLITETIASRLATFSAATGRARQLRMGDVLVVDDSYNANPSSMRAAVRSLCEAAPARRVLVMGDMLELGGRSDEFHQAILHEALRAGVDMVVAVGDASTQAVRGLAGAFADRDVLCSDSADHAADLLRDRMLPGDTVWIKGSREIGLERVVAELAASCKGEGLPAG